MVFIVQHFETEQQFEDVQKAFTPQQVLCCGSTFIQNKIDTSIPYHPLVLLNAEASSTIAQQHSFIDLMCRAIQIEVPEKIIVLNSTLLDTETVWQRIQQHAAIVGVPIEYAVK